MQTRTSWISPHHIPHVMKLVQTSWHAFYIFSHECQHIYIAILKHMLNWDYVHLVHCPGSSIPTSFDDSMPSCLPPLTFEIDYIVDTFHLQVTRHPLLTIGQSNYQPKTSKDACIRSYMHTTSEGTKTSLDECNGHSYGSNRQKGHSAKMTTKMPRRHLVFIPQLGGISGCTSCPNHVHIIY